MEHPNLCDLQLKSFVLNFLPLMPQSIAVKLDIDNLALGDEFTRANDPANIEENNKEAFCQASDLPQVIQSWKCRALLR